MLKAALMNKGVEKNRALEEGEELQVVSSLVKQRRDSIEQFTAGGRTDLAEKEEAEIAILEAYLPPSVSAGDLERAVVEAIAETAPRARRTWEGDEGGHGARWRGRPWTARGSTNWCAPAVVKPVTGPVTCCAIF